MVALALLQIVMEGSGGDPAAGMPVIMVFFLIGFLIFHFGIDFERAHADIAPTLQYRHNFENVQPNDDKVKYCSFTSFANSHHPFSKPYRARDHTGHQPPRPNLLNVRLLKCTGATAPSPHQAMLKDAVIQSQRKASISVALNGTFKSNVKVTPGKKAGSFMGGSFALTSGSSLSIPSVGSGSKTGEPLTYLTPPQLVVQSTPTHRIRASPSTTTSMLTPTPTPAATATAIPTAIPTSTSQPARWEGKRATRAVITSALRTIPRSRERGDAASQSSLGCRWPKNWPVQRADSNGGRSL